MAHLRGVGWLKLVIVVSIAPMFGGLGAVPAAGMNDGDLTVMTRNLDTGTDFGYLFGPGALPNPFAAVVATYQEVVASDSAGRAGLIAEEIRATRPDLVALQEADLWRLAPMTNPAQQTVTIDQLQQLLDALTARDLHYSAVVVAQNQDIQVPTFTALGFVRFTDRDVILARSDEPAGRMSLSNPQTHQFVHALVVPSALGPVTVLRSWQSVDVTTGSHTIRFIGTHLEAFDPVTQTGQAHEIATGPANTTMPLILAGDMNSGPGTQTLGYDQLLKDGFSDTWTTTQSGESGFTSPLYLEDPTRPFPAGPFQRIDLVLTRGDVVPVADSRVGVAPPFGSDHVGVVSVMSGQTHWEPH